MTRKRPGPKPGTTVTVSHAERCPTCGRRFVLIATHMAKKCAAQQGRSHAP